MNIFICMCVYMYVCMYVCMHICIYVFMYICIYVLLVKQLRLIVCNSHYTLYFRHGLTVTISKITKKQVDVNGELRRCIRA